MKVKINIIGETVAEYPNFKITKLYREECFFPHTAISYGVTPDTSQFRKLVGYGIVSKKGILLDKAKYILILKNQEYYYYPFSSKPTQWDIDDLKKEMGLEIIKLYDITKDNDFNVVKSLVTYDSSKDKYEQIMKKIDFYYKNKYIENKNLFYFEHKEEIDNLPDID